MSSEKASGPRIVVVGASSGVGRAFASLAIREGADVVAVARRRDALEELVKEAGGGRFLTIDLADAADCGRLGLEAETLLGSVDIVLFTAGTGQLKPIVLQDQKDWIQAFSVNVVGVNLAIAALLPFLAPRAIVAAVSTESVGSPHWGLASYVASKAALEESFRSWRTEHPEHRFTVIPIGTTIPTDFGKSFTQELLLEAFEKWTQVGKQTQMMEAGEVAAAIFYNLVTVLPSTSVGIEQIVIRPAAAVTGSSDVYVQHATNHKLID